MAKVIAAGIFLVKRDGNILICHPTNHPMDFWSIPKGKVDEGEYFIDAALRETFEETNIDLRNNIDLIKLEPVNYKHGKKILHTFLALESKSPNLDWNAFNIKCNSNVPEDRGGFPEMDDYKWVSLDVAEKLLHYVQALSIPTIRKIIV